MIRLQRWTYSLIVNLIVISLIYYQWFHRMPAASDNCRQLSTAATTSLVPHNITDCLPSLLEKNQILQLEIEAMKRTLETMTTSSESDVFDNCIVPAYGYPGYELKWVLEVLLGQLHSINCSVLLRSDKQMGQDFRSWTLADGEQFRPAYPHVIIFWRDEKLWENPLYRDYLRLHSTMIQFSDENEDFPIDYYAYFKNIYRNYRGVAPQRAGSMGHLLANGVDRMSLKQLADEIKHDDGQVAWWFPIGYSSAILSGTALLTPLWQRPKLFFWAGQLATEERRQFVAAMESDKELMALGKIHTYGGWQVNLYSSEHLEPDKYTLHMYDASIVPCPSGGSPDQFRISEALETGSILMLRKGHAHLRYMDELGLHYIAVNEWSECARELNRAIHDQAFRDQLSRWQQENIERWGLIKKRLGRHFAAIVYESVLNQRELFGKK